MDFISSKTRLRPWVTILGSFLGLITTSFSNTSIDLLPGGNEIELITETQNGFTYELQSSSNLTDWLTITEAQSGDGNVLTIAQTLANNSFYRFRTIEQTEQFAPVTFPFDEYEDFGISLPGFEEPMAFEPVEENKVNFTMVMHVDPENNIGVTGEILYEIREGSLNTAEFLITYGQYTTSNIATNESTERSPQQQATLTMMPQITEILYVFQFLGPNTGEVTITTRFTDDSLETVESNF